MHVNKKLQLIKVFFFWNMDSYYLNLYFSILNNE